MWWFISRNVNKMVYKRLLLRYIDVWLDDLVVFLHLNLTLKKRGKKAMKCAMKIEIHFSL